MDTCEELKENILSIKEKFDDILDRICGKGNHSSKFDVVEIKNPYGGNPSYVVTFSYVADYVQGNEKKFVWQLASASLTTFVDSIKAYMFECVDTIVALV